MQYYFAYGSNMDFQQMKDRCPDSFIVGEGELRDFQLEFNIFSAKRRCGCADIVHSLGNSVWGLIYQLTPEDLSSLDKYEGCPDNYKRIEVTVVKRDGSEVRCQSYDVVRKQGPFLPSREYLQKITTAATTFRFPKSYVDFLSRFNVIDGAN
jgi:gamma-glutamylcyclotransferase (GGCT)/AIG2-like uncharacterized protein YtfP